MFPTETWSHIISYINNPELIKEIFNKDYFRQYIIDKLTCMIKKKKLIKPDDHIPYRLHYLHESIRSPVNLIEIQNNGGGTTCFSVDPTGATITNKLTVTGLIDPTGLVLT